MSPTPKNIKDKQFSHWQMYLREFTKREWSSIVVCLVCGAIAAGFIRLTLWDRSFQNFLSSKYAPNAKLFDDPESYLLYLVIAGALVLLGVTFRLPIFLRRYWRSSREGVVSGLRFLSFISIFVPLNLRTLSL